MGRDDRRRTAPDAAAEASVVTVAICTVVVLVIVTFAALVELNAQRKTRNNYTIVCRCERCEWIRNR